MFAPFPPSSEAARHQLAPLVSRFGRSGGLIPIWPTKGQQRRSCAFTVVVYLAPKRKACINVCTDFCGASEIGTALVALVRETAAASGSGRLWLTTTNDNLHAPRFYPTRGFRLAVLYPDAVKQTTAAFFKDLYTKVTKGFLPSA